MSVSSVTTPVYLVFSKTLRMKAVILVMVIGSRQCPGCGKI